MELDGLINSFSEFQAVRLGRNTDYWRTGRPYLDGIEFTIVNNPSSAVLSFVAGRFDMTFPWEVTPLQAKFVKKEAPAAPGGGNWFHQHFSCGAEPMRVINYWGGAPGTETPAGIWLNRYWEAARTAGIDDPQHRFTYVECRVQSTIVNDSDGRPTQLTPADDNYIDYFGRPWADNWEKHFEQGWEKPPLK